MGASWDTGRVIKHLQDNKSLQGLAPVTNGRTDLSHFHFPDQSVLGRRQLVGFQLERRSRPLEFHNVTWAGIDFARASLRGLLFFGSKIQDCSFRDADCRGTRFWECSLQDSDFTGANLTDAVLGAFGEGERVSNSFSNVAFDGCRLGRSVHFGDYYEGCSFKHAALEGLEFRGSVFRRCVFEGKLRSVTFFERCSEDRFGVLPPNSMQDCDLGGCELEFVAFRNINLLSAKLPDNERHIILRHGPADLRALLRALPESRAQGRWYLEQIIPRLGTPSIIAVSDFDGLLEAEDIATLRRFASS